jgi:predicted N-acetyltransferase YhbS
MRAIAFYKRFGFDDVGSGTFVLGTSAQDDRIFALDLTRNRSASSG